MITFSTTGKNIHIGHIIISFVFINTSLMTHLMIVQICTDLEGDDGRGFPPSQRSKNNTYLRRK